MSARNIIILYMPAPAFPFISVPSWPSIGKYFAHPVFLGTHRIMPEQKLKGINFAVGKLGRVPSGVR